MKLEILDIYNRSIMMRRKINQKINSVINKLMTKNKVCNKHKMRHKRPNWKIQVPLSVTLQTRPPTLKVFHRPGKHQTRRPQHSSILWGLINNRCVKTTWPVVEGSNKETTILSWMIASLRISRLFPKSSLSQALN